MATSRQEMIEEIAGDLAAERCYADMLAHPETVVDAFDLLAVPAFDYCDRNRHYVVCKARNGESCDYVWHHCWDAYTAYHSAEACPNANETIDGAWRACEPPEQA